MKERKEDGPASPYSGEVMKESNRLQQEGSHKIWPYAGTSENAVLVRKD